MRLFAFGVALIAAFTLSAGTASAQYAPRGGYAQPVPSYDNFGGSQYGGYGNFGGSRYTPNYGGGGFGGGSAPAPRGHYDYVPGHFDRHRGHYDYTPGHYEYHAPFTPRPRH